MSAFIVSARKYRPVRFSEMVGQEHISQTLKNAIANQRLAHSFLFCGPRGVGKTTAARILAKTINCENLQPDHEACNDCSSCKSFNSNSSFNIYELDAASNNSVEDIRALNEQVRFAPQQGRFKIYIIDEVHMLSTSAFNAFLKTLEEPPAHCKFILATTEKHKILPTILSRCQVFDFRRMPVEKIVNHLQHICKLEKVEADEEALRIIAMKSDGGMRDALSMFDRLVSFGSGKLTYENVLDNLNVLDYDYFFKLTDSLLAEDSSAVLSCFDEIQRKGFEGDDFMMGLCEHFRNLLFCKEPKTLRLMEVSEALRKRYAAQSQTARTDFLLNCLVLGNQCDVQYRQSKNKRLLVELTLLRMCFIGRASELSEPKKKTIEPAGDHPVKESTVQQTTPVVAAATTVTSRNTESSASAPATVQPAEKLKTRKTTRLFEQEEQEKGNLLEEQPEAVVSLTPELVKQLLLSYLKQNERSGLMMLIESQTPVLNGSSLQLVAKSEVQQQLLEKEATGISHFIRMRTSQRVELEVLVNKEPGPSSVPYTSREKFERMVQRNPLLLELQKRFGIDYEAE